MSSLKPLRMLPPSPQFYFKHPSCLSFLALRLSHFVWVHMRIKSTILSDLVHFSSILVKLIKSNHAPLTKSSFCPKRLRQKLTLFITHRSYLGLMVTWHWLSFQPCRCTQSVKRLKISSHLFSLCSSWGTSNFGSAKNQDLICFLRPISLNDI